MIITDQQFDYWYDPCGSSGHDIDRSLTSRSRLALHRLRTFCKIKPVDSEISVKTIRLSNEPLFLFRALLDSQDSEAGSLSPLAQVVLRRLKGLLWHGERVDRTVLDDIVEAVESP